MQWSFWRNHNGDVIVIKHSHIINKMWFTTCSFMYRVVYVTETKKRFKDIIGIETCKRLTRKKHLHGLYRGAYEAVWLLYARQRRWQCQSACNNPMLDNLSTQKIRCCLARHHTSTYCRLFVGCVGQAPVDQLIQTAFHSYQSACRDAVRRTPKGGRPAQPRRIRDGPVRTDSERSSRAQLQLQWRSCWRSVAISSYFMTYFCLLSLNTRVWSEITCHNPLHWSVTIALNVGPCWP